MRVTELRLMETSARAIEDARERVAESGKVAQTGIAVDRPSQGLTAWVEGARSAARATLSAARGNAIARSLDGLGETDRVLDAIGAGLSRVRQLAIQAGNDTVDASARGAIAIEVRAIRDALLGFANEKGPDGAHLLGGTASGTPPFNPAGVYQGNTNRRSVEVAEGQSMPVTVTGEMLTSTAGADVFATIDTLAAALDADDGTAIRSSLAAMETTIEQVATARSEVGARMATLNQVDQVRLDFELSLAKLESRATEADPIAAVSDLAKNTAALENARTVADHIFSLVSGR